MEHLYVVGIAKVVIDSVLLVIKVSISKDYQVEAYNFPSFHLLLSLIYNHNSYMRIP